MRGTTVVDDGPAQEGSGDRPRSVPVLDRAPRLALATFIAVEAAAIAFYLWAGRNQWFFQDEWYFLADRRLSDPGSMLAGHFDHWTTLPAVSYRLLWAAFGLHEYWPYQLVAISSHLALAALLRVVMRRAGVSPWLATAAAAAFVLFGSGSENITWAFQITFTGGIAFGLVQLLLADHDGPINRRDALGLFAGLLAIMCSVTGVVMVGVVGLYALLRRGWRVAALHTVPLALVYQLWWSNFNHRSFDSPRRLPSWSTWSDFVVTGIAGAARGFSHSTLHEIVVALLLLVGTAMAIGRSGPRGYIRRAAAPIALLVGAVGFLVVTGFGRVTYYGAERAETSRYYYVVVALALPILVVAAQELCDRWPRTSPVVLAILLIGVPSNLAAADDRFPAYLGNREYVLTLTTVDAARRVPRDVQPVAAEPPLTMGFLTDAHASGRVPPPDNPTDRSRSQATIDLSLAFRGAVGAGAFRDCTAITAPTPFTVEAGDAFSVVGALTIVHTPGGRRLASRPIDSPLGMKIDVRDGPLELTLEPVPNQPSPQLCTKG